MKINHGIDILIKFFLTIQDHGFVGLVLVVVGLVVDQVVVVLHGGQEVHEEEGHKADDHHHEEEEKEGLYREVRLRIHLLDDVFDLDSL